MEKELTNYLPGAEKVQNFKKLTQEKIGPDDVEICRTYSWQEDCSLLRKTPANTHKSSLTPILTSVLILCLIVLIPLSAAAHTTIFIPKMGRRWLGFFIFTDNHGSFSFIPPRKGLWTFTLMDGDSNKLIKGKPLEFDSSISIEVK